MVDPELQEAFVQFEKQTVRVPRPEIAAAQRVHPEVRSFVEAGISAVRGSRLVGSYARKTQAAHLKDIDVLFEIEDSTGTWRASASRALAGIASVAERCPLVTRTNVRVRAVELILGGHPFTVDLVPGIKPPSGPGMLLARNLPEEGRDDWTLENPDGQSDAALKKNALLAGSYIPAVRIVKFWNQGCSQPPPLKSYLAESIVWHAMKNGMSYPEAFVAFLEMGLYLLRPGRGVPDPGNPHKMVDAKMTPAERAHALALMEGVLNRARLALVAHGSAALTAWATIFGPAFPSPQNDPQVLHDALKRGQAMAVGAGISSAPGRPIIKPRSWRA
jgi:hypothetical protein